MQLLAVTVIAALMLGWRTWWEGDFAGLWFTPDQRAQYAYDGLNFERAVELFEDPAWKGVAAFRLGRYEAAAASFGRIPTAAGFFNRGNALMKNREYRKAVTAYEQAVVDDPDWTEAEENLHLARYVVEYIERSREQSDVGEQEELGADEYAFDNPENRGKETQIDQQSSVEIQSAEKWMRSVDTETRDFLQTRFRLEASREGGQ